MCLIKLAVIYNKNTTKMDEKELERLAHEELLNEAKRGKMRAETMGAMGWQRCPIPSTNKRFLTNMIKSTLEPPKKKDKTRDYHDKERSERYRRVSGDRRHKRKEPFTAKEHGTYRTNDHKKESFKKKYTHREDVPSSKSRHKKHKSKS